MNPQGWRAWCVPGPNPRDWVVYDSVQYPSGPPVTEDVVGFVIYYDERAYPGGPWYRDIVDNSDWYIIRADGTIGKSPEERWDGTWSPQPDLATGERALRSAASLPDPVWKDLKREMMERLEWP